MATYVNDLRLKEIATGDESGTWGDTTNTNLELIAEAFSYGTEAITTNADTHTTTIADGASDPGRSMYLKYTGTLDSACTITIGPNTVSKMWFIENGTSGSQNIIISQGSGANITIPPGDVKVVYSDGAGSGAAVVDAFASLSVVDLKVQDDLTVTDDMTVGGTLGVTGIVTLTDDLIIGDGKTIGSASDVDAMTIAANGQVTFTQTLIGTALDISGDIDVDGTTNLDVVDIDGAVDMASTLNVSGAITGTLGTAAQPNITSLGTLTTLTVDDITINGSTISDGAALTLDAATEIFLDSDSGYIYLKDDGTSIGLFKLTSSDFYIKSVVSDKDIIFQGNDGGSAITALTLDMSNAGAATFNSSVRVDNSASTPVRLQLNNTGSNDYASIYADTASAYKNLVLNPDGGSVGIGTASPAFENGKGLEIRNSNGNGAHLKLTDNASGTGGTQGFDLYMFNSQGYIENYENAPIIFRQNGGESARFDADKKLLLGTSTSGTTDLLQIESPANGGGYGIQIRRNDNNTDQTVGRIMMGNTVDSDLAMIAVKTDGANNSGAIQFKTASSQTTATKMTINNAGSVGIGVADGDVTNDGTAARTYVGIIGTANRGRLNLGSTASNGADGGTLSFVNGANELGNIYMDANSGSQTVGKMYINSTDVLDIRAAGGVVFNENSVDADFRVESNGNANMLFVDAGNDAVLIGKSSDAFATAGAVFATSQNSSFTRDGGNVLALRRNTDGGDMLTFYSATTKVGSIGNASGDLHIDGTASHSGIRFQAQSLLPRLNGSDTDNSIDLGYDDGTDTHRFRNLYLSGGAYIGGSGSANYLDDYEEGTWTPAVSHGGVAATMVNTGASGSYTKIGRMVTLQGNAKVQTVNGTGNATITGFPFTVGDTVVNTGVEGNGVIGYYASWGENVNSLVVLAVQSSTTGEIYGNHNASGVNASATAITQAEVNANAEFRFTLTYFTS